MDTHRFIPLNKNIFKKNVMLYLVQGSLRVVADAESCGQDVSNVADFTPGLLMKPLTEDALL